MSLRIAFRHAVPSRGFAVDITAPIPGTTMLFGPSGAGKSTIAAVAAGLLCPAECYVAVGNYVLTDTTRAIFEPPERRRIGVVFQDGRLFPHLSVAENLRYGLRRAQPGPIGWSEVLGLLGISDLLQRGPAHLSGGERQRVAIGRAMLSQPRLLVLDEPLAGLDRARRAEIMPYLARLRDHLALPILYITHDLDEVSRLADTLVLIDQGRSVAAGPLAEIAARSDLPLAQRDDAGAVFACTVAGHLPQRSLTRLAVAGGNGRELLVPLQSSPVGSALRVRVPAADVILATAVPNGISVQNTLAARIVGINTDPLMRTAIVELRLGMAPFLARVTPDAVARLRLVPGAEVLALIKSVSIQLLG